MFTAVELSLCGRRFLFVPSLSLPKTFHCPVCGRECDADQGSRHHVLPKSQGGRTVEVICRPCHRQIHNLFSVKELAQSYNTV
ncbi:MAG: HNH endonuclease [Armatimonadota bacterium]|nr:HNH endonuclease [Armatimonadota bacterium]